MRRSTFISLMALLVLLSIYFLAIDPLLADNRWAAFFISMLMFVGLSMLTKKLHGCAKLDKRFDAQTSVWLVVGVLLFFTVFISAWQ
ncbi:MAG TPA: hypothetical protein VLQ20_01510 [Planococcus sp. (in: firmicutes)]|nr:hypothetical protein [Planococcus sp. (in: firmicutes)]